MVNSTPMPTTASIPIPSFTSAEAIILLDQMEKRLLTQMEKRFETVVFHNAIQHGTEMANKDNNKINNETMQTETNLTKQRKLSENHTKQTKKQRVDTENTKQSENKKRPASLKNDNNYNYDNDNDNHNNKKLKTSHDQNDNDNHNEKGKHDEDYNNEDDHNDEDYSDEDNQNDEDYSETNSENTEKTLENKHCKQIFNVFRYHGEMTPTQVAVMIGYSRTSTSFQTAFKKMNDNGYFQITRREGQAKRTAYYILSDKAFIHLPGREPTTPIATEVLEAAMAEGTETRKNRRNSRNTGCKCGTFCTGR
jgi:hypothetical protein